MIKVADICGTCKGSTNALNLIYEIYEREIEKENPKRICIYKEILHNEKVLEELNDLGIVTINKIEECDSNDIVILRAHGESKNTYDYLNANQIEYYDATCPKVSKIHEKVYQKYLDGYEIILVGKKNHPEIIGTNGWCNNEGLIIDSLDDLNKISDSKKKYITSQTTISPAFFKEVTSLIKDKYLDAEIIIDDTTCNAVEKIKESGLKLAKEVDIVFVIGGENSSNTEEVYNELSRIVPCKKFSHIKEFMNFILNSREINEKTKIGITGGASTPIKEIYNYKYLLAFLIFYKEKYQEFKDNQEAFNEELFKEKDQDNDLVQKVIFNMQDLNQGGKYIRATLIALGYYLTGNKDKKYLDLGYAYETFQSAI